MQTKHSTKIVRNRQQLLAASKESIVQPSRVLTSHICITHTINTL